MNHQTKAPQALTIVGPGRVGTSIAKAAAASGIAVEVLGRDFDPSALVSRTVLICVPDSSIAEVAGRIAHAESKPKFTGHSSGAGSLDLLAGSQTDGAFSLHPLQTVPDGSSDLSGCPGAIAGSTAEALAMAGGLADSIGMQPFEIAEADRAVYHAAASIASNYLVTLEQTAADLLAGIGVDDPRTVLGPLVRRSLENWQVRGPAALTGPITRGDEDTVSTHRQALSRTRPDLLPMYDAMAERTRYLVASAGDPA